MEPEDIPTLVDIESQSFAHPNWTAEDFTQNDCTVAQCGQCLAGFLVSRETFAGDDSSPPEREILNLAVAPEYRRRGVASALLKREVSRHATHFLEVRRSNVSARKLYERFGFTQVAERTGYYQYPSEAAIVMKMK
jgi:ribosomal-protein-alanine N-acetyltransferase